MKINDALTYHSCVAHAPPEHYVVMKVADQRVTSEAGVIIHIGCCTDVDHEWNASYCMNSKRDIAIYIEEKNPEWGHIPCTRCKLY